MSSKMLGHSCRGMDGGQSRNVIQGSFFIQGGVTWVSKERLIDAAKRRHGCNLPLLR